MCVLIEELVATRTPKKLNDHRNSPNDHRPPLKETDFHQWFLEAALQLKIGQTVCVLTLVSPTHIVCSRSLDPFYIVTYYIKWVKTSWIDSA